MNVLTRAHEMNVLTHAHEMNVLTHAQYERVTHSQEDSHFPTYIVYVNCAREMQCQFITDDHTFN